VHLILDNLPTHHSKVVKEWAEKRKDKIELHYLPSYSPDLNPDEYLNCDLKAELAKSGSRKNRTQFQGQVKSKMRSLSNSQGTSLIKSNSLKCIILNFMLVTFKNALMI
jgi:hypothetical protein